MGVMKIVSQKQSLGMRVGIAAVGMESLQPLQLHHLHTLNLAYNDFNYSSIPHNIGRLTNLRHLNLSAASFDGKIPTEISYLSNLVSLDLSFNYGLQLDERTFETMLQNFTNLEILSLFEVNISSPIPVSIHPNSSLFQLHHLHTLKISHFYHSSIPNGIGRLRNLRHLKLSHFDGKIPTEISYLSNLVSLHLSSSYGNELQLDERTFEAMFQNFTNLELLSLSEVNISSPIPVNISSSSSRYLDLGYTNLRGVLTESFFLPPNSLETLKLSGNDLLKGVFPKIHRSNTLLMELDISFTGISGELPDSIGTFSSLNILNLHRCQFSGSIPDSIGNLTQIRELILSHNHFTGHIPSTISKLKHLTSLDLSDNSFSGEILDVFSNLKELRTLYLSDNSFSGEIPDVFSNLKELRYLDLSDNSFSGEIPDGFSNLQELRYLDLSYNNFNGSFPASILSLTHLEYLRLSSNSISGPLPSNQSIQKLTSVDLSYNSLNGTIPSWVFSLPLLSSVSLQHNRFRGLANEVIKTNPTIKQLHLSNNQLSGSFPQSLVNLTNLETLGISSNNITIDEGMSITFLSLSSLFLSSCQLKDFPHFLRNVKTLVYLDISNNKIRGQIPDWFSGMRWDSLQFLNLSHNSLTGQWSPTTISLP
ncbi:LRR receptor-like serine/threonine-protein kinase GSO1 [Solanum stenotomum]|uniref:LRR receptor-like serine/threonine-protein kinase GSO1 n=1 Tax=Solanum stenotomum TaxID=172797 RepID=UPI0020D183E0|nr:LRR receptor-like serine/threonine-protein kinase GSO1 [Solanum stenotomum]